MEPQLAGPSPPVAPPPPPLPHDDGIRIHVVVGLCFAGVVALLLVLWLLLLIFGKLWQCWKHHARKRAGASAKPAKGKLHRMETDEAHYYVATPEAVLEDPGEVLPRKPRSGSPVGSGIGMMSPTLGAATEDGLEELSLCTQGEDRHARPLRGQDGREQPID